MSNMSATSRPARQLHRLASARSIRHPSLVLATVALTAALVLPATAHARADAGAVVNSAAPPTPTMRALSTPLSPSVAPLARSRGGRAWYRYPASTFVASQRRPGQRLTGMIIIYNRQSQPVSRCTGTVVNSPNGSVVWTAGHCVRQRGLDFARFAFIPGASAGSSWYQPAAPYGVWWATASATTRDWARHGSARHMRRDFGALLLGRNPAGQTIRQALGGAQRISFKGTIPRRAQLLGYPAAGRFKGNDALIGCGPRPVGRQPMTRSPGPVPLGTQCSMTEGSSGGPWLTKVNRRGIGTVVSVISVRLDNRPTMVGGVMNRAIRSVWAGLARRRVP